MSSYPQQTKLDQLRADLGNRTSFVAGLATDFRSEIDRLPAVTARAAERADAVHRLAGSAAMLAPAEILNLLLGLEAQLRTAGVDSDAMYEAVVQRMRGVINTIDQAIGQMPRDGEPA